MSTQNTNCRKGYRILQRLTDLAMCIVCAAGLAMALILARLWL